MASPNWEGDWALHSEFRKPVDKSKGLASLQFGPQHNSDVYRKNPAYESFYRMGLGRAGGYGYDNPGAGSAYLRDMQNTNKTAIDYIRRINEDEDFAASQTKKARKYAQEFIDADEKGGYGVSNWNQAAAINQIKEHTYDKFGDGGAFNSLNDIDMVNRHLESQMSDYEKPAKDDFEKNQLANSDKPELKNVVLSEHMQKAKDIVDDWESANPPYPIFSSNTPTNFTPKRSNAPLPVFQEGLQNQAKGRKVHQLHQDIDIANLTDPDAFLENKVKEVVDSYGIEREF